MLILFVSEMRDVQQLSLEKLIYRMLIFYFYFLQLFTYFVLVNHICVSALSEPCVF